LQPAAIYTKLTSCATNIIGIIFALMFSFMTFGTMFARIIARMVTCIAATYVGFMVKVIAFTLTRRIFNIAKASYKINNIEMSNR